MHSNDRLFIDLADLAIADVEILAQEGSRGMAELAASCGQNCNVANACSCGTTKQPDKPVSDIGVGVGSDS